MKPTLYYSLAALLGAVCIVALVEYMRSAPEESPTVYWSTDIEPQRAEVEGLSLRYVRVGNEKGRTVLLLHTLRTQLDMYQNIIPVLAKDYMVYALDYPGHGFSDIPDADYDAAFFRKHVDGFINEMGIYNVIMVGESIGASLALQFAGQGHPRITAIVAINPYDYYGGRGLARSSMLGSFISTSASIPVIGEAVMAMRNQFIIDNVLLGGVTDDGDFPEALLDHLYQINNRAGYSNMFLTLLRNGESWVDDKSLYSDTYIPALVLWGSDDWASEDERKESTISMPGAEVRTIPNVGHFMTVDQPDAIIDAVNAVNEKQTIGAKA